MEFEIADNFEQWQAAEIRRVTELVLEQLGVSKTLADDPQSVSTPEPDECLGQEVFNIDLRVKNISYRMEVLFLETQVNEEQCMTRTLHRLTRLEPIEI